MHYYLIVLGVLGVWRITHLLQAEDGPWDLVVRLRRRAGDGFWGELLDCFNCLSLWIAAPFAYLLGADTRELLLLWPALSAAAILLQRATDRGAEPPAVYIEDGENEDVMLRKEEGADPRSDALA
ncbi:MAG: hypothetical protein GY856_17675 [bacterium]|nr:hypothetical protein [bacterium]